VTLALPIAASTASHFGDLMLALCASPGRTCEQSGLMLARILPSGVLELLSIAAWARVLGYPPHELSGKWLHDLMPSEESGAGALVAALLGETDTPPLEVTLRCKDERRKCFRLHRRFDAYDKAIFVLADEVCAL
jgi:hypothetical protein